MMDTQEDKSECDGCNERKWCLSVLHLPPNHWNSTLSLCSDCWRELKPITDKFIKQTTPPLK